MEQVSEELKSEHLWSMVEDFTREGRWPENENDAPNDFNTPDFVARAMLDDLRTLRAQLAAAQARIAELEAGQAQLEGVVRLAYRKHHLEDDSIGWDELSDALKDALCEVWGDELYLTWLKANSPANMRRKGGDDAE